MKDFHEARKELNCLGETSNLLRDQDSQSDFQIFYTRFKALSYLFRLLKLSKTLVLSWDLGETFYLHSGIYLKADDALMASSCMHGINFLKSY